MNMETPLHLPQIQTIVIKWPYCINIRETLNRYLYTWTINI